MLRAEARPGHFTASRILLLPELRYSLLRVPYGAPHSETKRKTDAGYECDRENPTSQKPWRSEAQFSLTVALGPHPRGQTQVLGVAHLETTKADPDPPSLLSQGESCSTSGAGRKPPGDPQRHLALSGAHLSFWACPCSLNTTELPAGDRCWAEWARIPPPLSPVPAYLGATETLGQGS